MCVNTPPLKHWPERDAFFEWFDERKKIAKLKHDSVIARMAGLDSSAVSSWRSGRTRPTTASLTGIAKVLDAAAQEVWARAGHLTDQEVAAVERAGASEDWGIKVIREYGLPPDKERAMIAAFVAQEQRARAERERQLREQMEIFAGSTDGD